MDKVRIGPMTYEIKIVERLVGNNSEKLDGQIEYCSQTIKIESGSTLEAQRQTLWHEIVHGILTQSGRHDEIGEGAIDALAYGIYGVIADNPGMSDKQ